MVKIVDDKKKIEKKIDGDPNSQKSKRKKKEQHISYILVKFGECLNIKLPYYGSRKFFEKKKNYNGSVMMYKLSRTTLKHT
jgi:hypothetical protein